MKLWAQLNNLYRVAHKNWLMKNETVFAAPNVNRLLQGTGGRIFSVPRIVNA